MYIVEWFGTFYGPFDDQQAAHMFRPPVTTSNAFAAGKVHPLHSGRMPTLGELQEKMIFPNGR